MTLISNHIMIPFTLTALIILRFSCVCFVLLISKVAIDDGVASYPEIIFPRLISYHPGKVGVKEVKDLKIDPIKVFFDTMHPTDLLLGMDRRCR